MYSAPANSWLWIRGEIDAYLSLQDPLYHWRASVLKMVDSRYRPLKKTHGVIADAGRMEGIEGTA